MTSGYLSWRKVLSAGIAACAALACAGWLIVALAQAPKPVELDVPGSKVWTDTGMDVAAGARMVISATGTLQYEKAKPSGPQGLPRGWRDLVRLLPLNEAKRGALIARIGDGPSAQPFLIGAKREFEAPGAGRLWVGINQESRDQAKGNFRVKIEVAAQSQPATTTTGTPATTPAGATSVVPQPVKAPTVNRVPPGVTPDLLNKIPRRITDEAGSAGDMVNFLLIGPEDKMREAFKAAGWVLVDRSNKGAVIHAALATLSKQAYTELPMSELFLFGRAQDFGFAHAEPLVVVARRHHLRLWKAPFQVEGQTLWVGAATHDIGIEKDKRNGKLTHRIDPAVDKERDYVGESLGATGIVTSLAYTLPSQPVKEAKTATGGSFHSDGRILVMPLAAMENDRSLAFAELFCAVLQQEHPDAGKWGACGDYLEMDQPPAAKPAALGALASKYKVLIVPGVFSSCVTGAPAFQQGQEHLREKHGMTVELFVPPNDSSEANAARIADYLKEHGKSDERKYIVLGYSKGAPDLQVMLANDAVAAKRVAALVTVAGAVGGSPIADALPGQADRWLNSKQVMECQGDIAAAFRSLQREERRAFLRNYPEPFVPTYSVAAVSAKENTSKSLLQAWQIIATYDPKQDGQLTKPDAVVPGAVYLGTARGDHFAVALPFEFASDANTRATADHNHFPRTTLLEAVVRFVVQDLDKPK